MTNQIILYSYLLEIRYRLFYLLISFSITFLISYLYSFDLLFLMVQPFYASKNFIFTDLAEALSSTVYVSCVATIHLVIPFFLYQCWAFSIPGFYNQERKKISFFLLSFLVILLLEGLIIVLFLLPEIYHFLLSFEIKKEILTIQLEARILSYIRFTFSLYLYLLSLFQIPLTFFFLFYYNIVTAKTISFYRKYFYFFFLLIAAFVSPPDIIYQLTMAFCLVFFYEIGLWLGFVYERFTKGCKKIRI